MLKKILLGSLSLAVLLSACASPESSKSKDLMAGIQAKELEKEELENWEPQGPSYQGLLDFSLTLFKDKYEEENLLISPLSIVSALGMVTNGAEGQTLDQMEAALGASRQQVNTYLKAYQENLGQGDHHQVKLANAIWFRDIEGLKIEEDFLQVNQTHYGADLYQAPFDQGTKKEINSWVEEKTDGLIDSILDNKIPDRAIMYLINALAFDAQWEEVYFKNQVDEGTFTLENGDQQAGDFMFSQEHAYLENDYLQGVIKPYQDNQYAFVALLPKEGMTMADFLSRLEGEDLKALLDQPREELVYTSLPKFSVESTLKLEEALAEMGMGDAFDEDKADFTSLGHSSRGNISIDRIVHKTKMVVDEEGTQAGAATAIEMVEGAMAVEPKEINLDRPFFYLIIDRQANFPLFMGSLMSLEEK